MRMFLAVLALLIAGSVYGAATTTPEYHGNIVAGAWQATPVAVAYGGTASATAADARAALGLAIGTNVLAPNGSAAALTAIPGANITAGTVARAALATESKIINVPASALRNIDFTAVSTSASAGCFGVTSGGYSSGTLTLISENANNNTKTDTLVFELSLPSNYVDAGTVSVSVYAKYTENGTVGTHTLDCQAYEVSTDGTAGGDICATTIKTLTTSFAAQSFTLTPTSLVQGDRVLVFIQGVIQETASGGNDKISIGAVTVTLQVKG